MINIELILKFNILLFKKHLRRKSLLLITIVTIFLISCEKDTINPFHSKDSEFVNAQGKTSTN